MAVILKTDFEKNIYWQSANSRIRVFLIFDK
jgi:hypothetical protein